MLAIVNATKGEPAVRDALAFDLMAETLYANDFSAGISVLDAARVEKIAPALIAQAVERARHG